MKAQHLNFKRKAWLSNKDMWLGLVLSSLCINLLSLAFPIAILQIYDRVVPNHSMSTLYLLCIGVLIALILETVLRIARSCVSAWSDARFEHRISSMLFERVLNSRFGALQSEGAGQQLEKLSSLNALKNIFGGQMVTTSLDAPFVIIFIALIAYIGGWLVIVPIITIFFIFAYTYLQGFSTKPLMAQQKSADDRRMNFIIEVLTNIHTVKSLALEAQILRRYERLQDNTANIDHGICLENGKNQRFAAVFSQLSIIFVVALGCLMTIQGALTLGGLAACTLLNGRCVQPINRVATIWANLQGIDVSIARIQSLLDLPQEVTVGKKAIVERQGPLLLDKVSFSYSKDDKPVLQDIHLSINFGECIALTGENFAGRTTLLNIIAGLHPPTSGKVFYAQQDVYASNIRAYREKIAYLPECGHLFEGSILDNITMFSGKNMMPDVTKIADLVGLTPAIERMQEGYYTQVAQATVDFIPHGIKQRIAIARALLHMPPIVLFDEANSSLDLQGDTKLREALRHVKGQSILIIVSQRPSTLEIADMTYRLAAGRLTCLDDTV